MLYRFRFGLRAIYPNGLKGDYNHIEKAKKIDFLSISLRGLKDVKEPIFRAISKNQAEVRILLLSPTSLFVSEREKQEGKERNPEEIKHECERTIRATQEVIERLTKDNVCGGSIELRTYDTMPYCSCVITDRQTRYTPYLMNLRAGSSMMLELSPKGPISENLRDHFEGLWTDGEKEVGKAWHC